MEGQSAHSSGRAPDQRLTRWTAILIVLRVVNEILLAESPVCSAAGGVGLSNNDGNAGFVARQNFFAFEIAPVCNRSQLLGSNGSTCLFGHGGQLVPVRAYVGERD